MAETTTTPPTQETIPTKADFDKALTELKSSTTVLRRVTADRDNAIRKAQDKYQPEIDRLTKEGNAARDVIQRYSVAHRNLDLLPKGKKSVCLNGVELGWRLSKPKLVFKEGITEAKALELIRKKLPDCIRKKEELDKTLLAAYFKTKEKVVAACGLVMEEGKETFFAEPETA